MQRMKLQGYETMLKHLKSVRDHLDLLRGLGEVQDIQEEVDLNLEIGAICRRVYETGSPAPLFQKIKGIEPGFRVLGAPAGVSRQPGLRLCRVATALGLPPTAGGVEIMELLTSSRKKKLIAPRVVPSGLCQEHVLTGKDVDLNRLPVPLLHPTDGGRYINTIGMVVVKTPDGSWTNYGNTRVMLIGPGPVDKTRMTGHVSKHFGVIHQQWKKLGEPAPFAVCLGIEPALYFIAATPLPEYVSEVDYLGAFFGEPAEVVRAATVDLNVPATAEIVVEGYVSASETASEGPLGGYNGYVFPGGVSQQPVFDVTAITYRTAPILPECVAGRPVDETHTAWMMPQAAEVLFFLRQNGIPATSGWMSLDAAGHLLVITFPRDWRTKGSDTSTPALVKHIADLLWPRDVGRSIAKIVLMNDDIDPSDDDQVMWAFASRQHPITGQYLYKQESISPLMAYLTNAEKAALNPDGIVGYGAKAIYNALWPDDMPDDQIPVNNDFDAFPQAIKDRVLSKWHAYGFKD